MEACRAELTVTEAYLARHRAFVVEHDRIPVGFYTLERQCDGVVELGFLFVEPAFIGQGYGRRLIEHAREQARSVGYSTLLIQGDPHAVPFYQAAGGRVIGTTPSASIAGRSLPLFEIALYAAGGAVAEGS